MPEAALDEEIGGRLRQPGIVAQDGGDAGARDLPGDADRRQPVRWHDLRGQLRNGVARYDSAGAARRQDIAAYLVRYRIEEPEAPIRARGGIAQDAGEAVVARLVRLREEYQDFKRLPCFHEEHYTKNKGLLSEKQMLLCDNNRASQTAIAKGICYADHPKL